MKRIDIISMVMGGMGIGAVAGACIVLNGTYGAILGITVLVLYGLLVAMWIAWEYKP